MQLSLRRGGGGKCPASCIALEMMGKQVDLCFLSYCTNGMWHFGSRFSPSELSHFSGFPKLPSSRNPCPRRAWRAAFRPYTPASLSGNGEGSQAVARQEECRGVRANEQQHHACHTSLWSVVHGNQVRVPHAPQAETAFLLLV